MTDDWEKLRIDQKVDRLRELFDHLVFYVNGLNDRVNRVQNESKKDRTEGAEAPPPSPPFSRETS